MTKQKNRFYFSEKIYGSEEVYCSSSALNYILAVRYEDGNMRWLKRNPQSKEDQIRTSLSYKKIIHERKIELEDYLETIKQQKH